MRLCRVVTMGVPLSSCRARPETCICGVTNLGSGTNPRYGSCLTTTCLRSRRGHNQLIEVPILLRQMKRMPTI